VKQLRDLTFARVDPDGYRPPAPTIALGTKPIFTADGCDIKLSQFCWTNCPARSGITQTPNELAPAAPFPRQLQFFRHSR